MAIGPQSRRMASGRLVVVAGGQLSVGITTLIVGIGPFAEAADAGERALAAAGLALGLAMLVGGTALLVRRGPARALGSIAAVAMGLAGTMVAALGLTSLDDCAGAATGCSLLVGGIVVAGAAVAATGAVSLGIIRRAHPRAFTRQRR